MKPLPTRLRFHDVDGLAYAAALGTLDEAARSVSLVPHYIGPLLEFAQLAASKRIGRPELFLESSGTAPLLRALGKSVETWTDTEQNIGFIRAARSRLTREESLTGFLIKAKRICGRVSGIPRQVAGQLVAAMRELENNIHEHAEAPETGFVAYYAEPGVFEFVVADLGVGIRHSLRCFEEFADDGKALVAALTEGVSRHGSGRQRGYGFRPIFRGLVNLYGQLRFRSGDFAVTMDGDSPELPMAKVTQKVAMDGFFASVLCHSNPSTSLK